MRIYLAGGMRGIPWFNHRAFHAAAALLRAQGHVVFNPAESEPANSDGDEANLAAALGTTELELRRQVFARDTAWICRHAEAIAMLPGWEKSKGARAELALAQALGLVEYYLRPEQVAANDNREAA